MDNKYSYLHSIIQKGGKIDSDIKHEIQAGWLMLKSVIKVSSDGIILLRLTRRFYWNTIGLVLLYCTDYWTIKRHCAQNMSVIEILMLRYMCGKTKRANMKDENILVMVTIAPIRRRCKKITYWYLNMCNVELCIPQFGEYSPIIIEQVKRVKERLKKI